MRPHLRGVGQACGEQQAQECGFEDFQGHFKIAYRCESICDSGAYEPAMSVTVPDRHARVKAGSAWPCLCMDWMSGAGITMRIMGSGLVSDAWFWIVRIMSDQMR